MNILRKLRLIPANPKRYLPLAFRWAASLPLRVFSPLMRRAPLFLQEQMDISRRSVWHDRDFAEATGAYHVRGDTVDRRIVELSPCDGVRRDMLILLLRSLVERNVGGDLAELGVYRGRSARVIHQYMPDRVLHLFDTFAGFTDPDLQSEAGVTGLKDDPCHYDDTETGAVLKTLKVRNENVRIHAGRFPKSLPPELDDRTFAFVHVDVDLYTPTLAALEFFFPRLAPGGMFVVHDYNAWPGPRRAVDVFLPGTGVWPIPMPDKNGSALIIKPGETNA